jgi:alpha-methylacyl-CoA racemase
MCFNPDRHLPSTLAMGPLAGVRVLELEAIGPVPFCGMLLADMGAGVLLVDRPADPGLGFTLARRHDTLRRGRRSVMLDLKHPGAREAALQLADAADVLLEGFRPGVMERLGLGPDVLLARNPRLVYGRMTGYGQEGPLAARAGHDIDYIALAGALHAIGRAGEPPVPPLNLVGDFGGGGMLLAFGVACALAEVRASGRGQVVDAAMVDGASLLATMFSGMQAAGQWTDARGANALDSGAPWYDTYATRDGRFVAVGAIEPRFYAALLHGLGLDAAQLPAQQDRAGWPALRERFAAAFATRTRDEWCAVFDGIDACVAPVLTFDEAAAHPQARARAAHVTLAGVVQPAPAPRLSRTPGEARAAPPERGEGGEAALRDWGFDAAAVARLAALGLRFHG